MNFATSYIPLWFETLGQEQSGSEANSLLVVLPPRSEEKGRVLARCAVVRSAPSISERVDAEAKDGVDSHSRAIGGDLSDRFEHAVAWDAGEASPVVVNVSGLNRFELEVLELTNLHDTAARAPRLRLTSAFVTTLDAAHGFAHHGEDAPVEAVDVVSYFAASEPTSAGASRWRVHPRLLAPIDRLQIARAIRAGLSPANASELCHFVVPLVKGEIGPVERCDLDLDEPIIVSARVDVEPIPTGSNIAPEQADVDAVHLTKGFVPVLAVRLPQALDKVDFLARFARCVHWRRQEDYVRLKREDAQSFRTGDAVVDGLLRMPEPPEIATDQVSRDRRGLYYYEVPFAEPAREDGEFEFQFRFPGVQYGDVFGLVFGPRDVRVALPTARPKIAPHSSDGHVRKLSVDESGLFVFRGDEVTGFAAEPVLLSNASLKSDIELLVGEVRKAIEEKSPRISNPESIFRAAAARNPEISDAAMRNTYLAPHNDAELPIPALDAYRQLLRTALSAASVGPALLPSDRIIDDVVRASLISQKTFRDEPAFVAAVVGDPDLLDKVLRYRAWVPGQASSSKRWPCAIPYALEMAGYAEPLITWVESLQARAALISWLLLSAGSFELIRLLADLDLEPDETLLADMRFSTADTNTQPWEQRVFEKLRKFTLTTPESWAAIERKTRGAARTRLQHPLNMVRARVPASSSPIAPGQRLTYTEVLLLLEAVER